MCSQESHLPIPTGEKTFVLKDARGCLHISSGQPIVTQTIRSWVPGLVQKWSLFWDASSALGSQEEAADKPQLQRHHGAHLRRARYLQFLPRRETPTPVCPGPTESPKSFIRVPFLMLTTAR